MNSSTIKVDPEDELIQGDIIRQAIKENENKSRWGFILTADCDIFQKKSGQKYSWLEIMHAADYLEHVWSGEQLISYIKKYSVTCLDYINSIIKKHHKNLSPLTNIALYDWLKEKSVEEILAVILPNDSKFDEKVKNLLFGIKAALLAETGKNLETLKNCWVRAGIDLKNQEAKIRNYLISSDGFPDFFVVPDLPDEEEYCFVIMLRSISTVEIDDIFKTSLDAKIAGKSSAFHRIGRFNDNVRYAVVQKFSFLFSRIGMPPHFESASSAAAEIVVESIFPKAQK